MVKWIKKGQSTDVTKVIGSSGFFFPNNLRQLPFLNRMVAMLADLGQKGGMLRLVGKIALLWGGIRGAMSLTDRLISFSHIAERPLFQR